jgi:hypothetical protein
MNNIDIEAFAQRGRISQKEAEHIHTHLMHLSGITDGDTIIADWNRRSPESLWGEDGDSSYIQSFTKLLMEFMGEKIQEARLKKGK